jgi:hypothetical protein
LVGIHATLPDHTDDIDVDSFFQGCFQPFDTRVRATKLIFISSSTLHRDIDRLIACGASQGDHGHFHHTRVAGVARFLVHLADLLLLQLLAYCNPHKSDHHEAAQRRVRQGALHEDSCQHP